MTEKDRAPAADLAAQTAADDEKASAEPEVKPADRAEEAGSDENLPKVKSEQST